MTPFAQRLRELRAKTGLGQWAFAKQAGMSRSLLALVETDERRPPLDNIESIADVLKLTGKEREDFIMLALLEHMPPTARARYEAAERTIADLTRRIEALERKRR